MVVPKSDSAKVEQLPETLWIEHDLYRLFTAPLSVWLRQAGGRPFECRSPACLRGYVGRWEIRDGGLWLIDMHGWIDGRITRVPHLFDGRQDVFADWFSGMLIFEPSAETVKEGTQALLQRVYVENGMLSSSRPCPV